LILDQCFQLVPGNQTPPLANFVPGGWREQTSQNWLVGKGYLPYEVFLGPPHYLVTKGACMV
jgi:hypothetical protein